MGTHPSPAADRNLLFGVLALQMDFVVRDDLLAAMHAWVLDKNKPLGQLLVERGALPPDDRAALDDLVERHVRRHGGDPARSLAAVGPDLPARTSLQAIGDPELQASLASLQSADTPPPPCADRPPAVGVPTSAGTRFKVLRPYAKGGLGEVFVARDSELGREVALKAIQERFADDAENRARFVLEAEITGGLEHPSVVPVYGLGAYPDGRPFYAMRFVKGDSFQQAIQNFHQGDTARRDSGERALALRELLGRFVAVCNAVAYAHSRGVVHRDVKPANVLLGPFGETLVVDWGLAKIVGRVEDVGEPTLRPTARIPSTATQAGAVVGTPGYLSPEQAGGAAEGLGPATDVYSLGATLYHLLTAVAPFPGGDLGSVLARVVRGDLVPPGRVKPGVPPALEAVCLRAMTLRPEERYASARELAREVERWLADEPVVAYSEPLMGRARRWGRRHSSLVSAGVVLLLAGVVGLAAGLWAVGREQARTRKALDEAEVNLERALTAEEQAKDNLARAEDNLKLARRAVDECFNVAKEHPLFQGPRMEKAKKLLLEKTLPFYRQFRAQRPGDRGLRHAEAEQLFRVAYIESFLGHYREALRVYRQACDNLVELAKAHPGVRLYLINLATTRNNLGSVLQTQGKLQEALGEYRQARAIRLKLVQAHRNVPQYQKNLAQTHNHLGVLLQTQGKRQEALGEFRQARAIRLKLAQAHLDVPEYQNDLANSHNNLGNLLSAQGQREEALAEYRQARAILLKLAQAHPEAPDYQNDLARTHSNLGGLLSAQGKREEALGEFQQARAIGLKLAQAHPDVPEYKNVLASTHHKLGSLLIAQGKREEALREFRQARAIGLKLTQAHPGVPRYLNNLATTHHNLAILLQVQGKREEALEEGRRARTIRLKLTKAHPEVPEHQNALASTHNNLAVLLQAQGKRAEALGESRQARAILLKLAKAHPDVPEYQNLLASTHNNLAGLLSAQGKREEALREYRQARAILLKLAKAHPDMPEYVADLVRICLNCGSILAAMNQHRASLSDLTEGIARTESLRRLDPSNANISSFLLFGLHRRAEVLTRLGRLPEADADWDRAAQLVPPAQRIASRLQRAIVLVRAGHHQQAAAAADALSDLNAVTPGNRYDLACVYALASAAAARDAAAPLSLREKFAEAHAARALLLLAGARDAGFFKDPAKLGLLDKDRDLDALRGRDDFKRFRAGLKPAK
jgi:serine/threonine-protein kinase